MKSIERKRKQLEEKEKHSVEVRQQMEIREKSRVESVKKKREEKDISLSRT
jgi:hypothetical protein